MENLSEKLFASFSIADGKSSNNSDIDISELTYDKVCSDSVTARNILRADDLSRCFRVSVEGYDTTLRQQDVSGILSRHFSDCGMVCHIVIPRDVQGKKLQSRGYVYFPDEVAQSKAVALSGSNVGFPFPASKIGGWVLYVEALEKRACEYSPEQVTAAHNLTNACICRFFIGGYPTDLPGDDVKRALCSLFRSCGEIRYIEIHKDPERPGHLHSSGIMRMVGEGAFEKALALDGTAMGSWTVTVTSPFPSVALPRAITPSTNIGWEGPPGHRWWEYYSSTLQ